MRWKTRAIAMVVVVVLMAVSFVIPVSAISDDEVAAFYHIRSGITYFWKVLPSP